MRGDNVGGRCSEGEDHNLKVTSMIVLCCLCQLHLMPLKAITYHPLESTVTQSCGLTFYKMRLDYELLALVRHVNLFGLIASGIHRKGTVSVLFMVSDLTSCHRKGDWNFSISHSYYCKIRDRLS